MPCRLFSRVVCARVSGCMCARMCALWAHVCVHTRVHVHMYGCMCTHVCICMLTCVGAHARVYTRMCGACVRTHVCVWLCTLTCVSACVFLVCVWAHLVLSAVRVGPQLGRPPRSVATPLACLCLSLFSCEVGVTRVLALAVVGVRSRRTQRECWAVSLHVVSAEPHVN